MSKVKFLFFIIASLALASSCMTSPGNGENVNPFEPITFKGFALKPDQKVYIYVKSIQKNQYINILEATSTTSDAVTDHSNPPVTLYPWQVQGTFNNYQDWDGPTDLVTNSLNVIPSLVPPNLDRSGPSVEGESGDHLIIFKPRQTDAILKYVLEDHKMDWTVQGVNQEFMDAGKGAATIQVPCGDLNEMCCNGDTIGLVCTSGYNCEDGKCTGTPWYLRNVQ